ncbi:helix-turn-helix domain-containing protein, partial [Mycolicibacterium novocastrense]
MPSGYPHPRSTRRELFDRVCQGVGVERAAQEMGVSTTAATLWWRQAGAMQLLRGNNRAGHGVVDPGDPDRPGGKGHRLSLDERIAIMRGLDAGLSDAAIAEQIGRDRSTVWREKRRNRNA